MCDGAAAMERLTDWSTKLSSRSFSESSKLRSKHLAKFFWTYLSVRPGGKKMKEFGRGWANNLEGCLKSFLGVWHFKPDRFVSGELENFLLVTSSSPSPLPTAEPVRSKVESCFPRRKIFQLTNDQWRDTLRVPLHLLRRERRRPRKQPRSPRPLRTVWTLNFKVQINPWDTGCVWCHAKR